MKPANRTKRFTIVGWWARLREAPRAREPRAQSQERVIRATTSFTGLPSGLRLVLRLRPRRARALGGLQPLRVLVQCAEDELRTVGRRAHALLHRVVYAPRVPANGLLHRGDARGRDGAQSLAHVDPAVKHGIGLRHAQPSHKP